MYRLLGTCAEGYEDIAFDEMRKADAGIRLCAGIDPGVFAMESGLEFPEFSRALRLTEPVFARHIHPIDTALPFSGRRDDLEEFAATAERWMPRFPADAKIAVQVRRSGGLTMEYTPFAVKETIDPFILRAGASPAIQDAEFAVSAYITQGQTYLGLSSTEDNLSDWAGGAMRLGRALNQASRSRFKLEEACLTFGVELQRGSRALDLGAAPGGWTSYLLDRELSVTAVDTGDMQPELLNNHNLRFVKANALTVAFPPDSFDILVCDMSWDPNQTARNLQRLSGCLKSGGIAIVTIKFMGRKVRQTIEEFIRILQPPYRSRRVKQLFHNRNEVTAYLVKN